MLQEELEDYYIKRSEVFSAKDVDGFGELITENSVLMIDDQIPVVGREGKAKRHNKSEKLFEYLKRYPKCDI